MDFRALGRTEIKVSLICLGTMTWGEQNTEAEAHAQLDYALDRGINFIDAAEMYPVPPRAETQGRTERHLGTWLKARGNSDKAVIATKAIGRVSCGDIWCQYVEISGVGGQTNKTHENQL